MLTTWVVVIVSAGYLGLLFGIAYYGDRRADAGRSIIDSGTVYALSLAVYATSWTYYGSVGRAATSGVGFLPIYLGPTLMLALGYVVLRKIIRISRQHRITSLADFVSARYGKSIVLGGLVTVIAVVGIVPYIALQLKAVSNTFGILQRYPELTSTSQLGAVPVLQDTALYVALLLAAFTIVFGTRHLDATERHEGMVAAIAFESVVKLVAFVAAGVFVAYGLFGGVRDLVAQASARADVAALFRFGGPGTADYGGWVWLVVLSMLAILLLPRQWQIAVVENVDERHLGRAMWLFPLYLLAINLFVLPITVAGLLTFTAEQVDADTFVLALPMAEGQELLALLVFVGGLSAATGMIIVETIALSTMVSNSLVVPALLRLGLPPRGDLGRRILWIRRATIVAVLLLGYGYFRAAGETEALVSIGLVSFAAVAQFAPALLGGLFWKGGTRDGAFAGLLAGFAVWIYTMLLPSFARSGFFSEDFLADGPYGQQWLRPEALFGLTSMDGVSHAMFWSMLVNVGGYVGVSLFGRRTAAEHAQAALFVGSGVPGGAGFWRGRATVADLRGMLERFLGPERTRLALEGHEEEEADPELVHHVETVLAGAVGTASARILVESVVTEEPLGLGEVMEILDEASQVRAYSRQLEEKSRELETATAELRAANQRLQELDRLKDDFVSTVSHELRTPLTSIRAFSEILLDNPELETAEREQFLRVVVEETERLTRLINQVLDLSKLESGRADWAIADVSLAEAVRDSAASTAQLFAVRGRTLDVQLPGEAVVVTADRDRLVQVLVNLLSNAAKFARTSAWVETQVNGDVVRIDVRDDGAGIAPHEQEAVFEKFHQSSDVDGSRPSGTGLGLPISRQIVEHLGGRLWVDSVAGSGAKFSFTVPLADKGER
jgi:Na+/proline symporter/nitrogen-specific signal transduction histidine kinase